MNNNTNKKILTYKEFSRENLFNLILDEYAPNIQVQDIDNPKKDITKDIFSPLRSEIRYELEKRTFILFLFNPVLESIYALRKSSLFDYITGLHLYILKSATTRLYDTEAKIICIVSKKGAQCIECHHKDI